MKNLTALILFIILITSCKSESKMGEFGFHSSNLNNYLTQKGTFNTEIIRIRYLPYGIDTLFVSFKVFKEYYTELDTSQVLLFSFWPALTNCMSIIDGHHLKKYSNYENLNNLDLISGIKYIIQLEDTINTSYFFKFEEMDNNLRKMDFELLPSMVSRKKNGI